jgi:Lrp/AsnC family leucine-responsive transcriptional regulator
VDRIDRKILALFQGDTRRIAAEIGEKVGLSAAAVQRRLKRLRKSGAIKKEIAVLDPAMAGVPITCIVTLGMVPHAAPQQQLDRFRRDMQAAAEIQQCYHVTGTVDFVLVVTSRSMEDYAAFARTWFESNATVARYDTHVVLERVKVGLDVPIAEAREIPASLAGGG